MRARKSQVFCCIRIAIFKAHCTLKERGSERLARQKLVDGFRMQRRSILQSNRVFIVRTAQ
jgi:hypothetical protein